MNAIKINNVHKKFKVYYDKGRTFKEKILFKNRNHYEDRWVLNGISFEVKKGEVLGLVGENGCGKSTLLKLMSRIIYPDKGSIEINGRVSSLIELGAGFHPDMSGRENIYTNASIFGLTKKEIDARLNDIISFSELEEFIDNPVRTYSSGMYMRLAFSVAINVDAEVLLIDEILAVGDANFQAKCFDRLRELKARGITIVIVTHDLNTIEKFCNKAIWINNGNSIVSGNSSKVVDAYLNYMNNKRIESALVNSTEKDSIDEEVAENDNCNTNENEIDNEKENNSEIEDNVESIDYSANRFGLKHVEIYKAILKNKDGQETNILKAGESAEIQIYYKINKKLDEYVFGMGIYTLEGVCIVGCNTQLDRLKITSDDIKDRGIIRYKIKRLDLLTGVYVLNVAVVDNNGTPLDFYRDYCHFNVVSNDRSVGLTSIQHEWEI